MVEHNITPGLKYIHHKEIDLYDTGANLGSRELDYMMSTPALATLVIESAFKLLEPLVPEGYTTVGKALTIIHEAPTLVGEQVHVEVRVDKVVGNHIHLDIRAWDRMGEIGTGSHERIVVDGEKLMADAYERAGSEKP